jgi:hypothetical protein
MSQVISSFFQDEIVVVVSILNDIIKKNRIEKTGNINFNEYKLISPRYYRNGCGDNRAKECTARSIKPILIFCFVSKMHYICSIIETK